MICQDWKIRKHVSVEKVIGRATVKRGNGFHSRPALHSATPVARRVQRASESNRGSGVLESAWERGAARHRGTQSRDPEALDSTTRMTRALKQ